MTLTKNKNYIIMGLILFVAFLIEAPLYSKIITFFPFLLNYVYLVRAIIFYIAILVCVLLFTKQYFNKINFFKSFSAVLLFAIIDNIISSFLFNEFIALCYQILRPLVAVAFIWLAIRWICKFKIHIDKRLLLLGVIAFAICVLFNVIAYIRMISLMPIYENIYENDFFAYLTLLAEPKKIYNHIATFGGYSIVYLSFITFTKSDPKIIENNSIADEEKFSEDGWKCMGCGKIVSLEKSVCDCGYKR